VPVGPGSSVESLSAERLGSAHGVAVDEVVPLDLGHHVAGHAGDLFDERDAGRVGAATEPTKGHVVAASGLLTRWIRKSRTGRLSVTLSATVKCASNHAVASAASR
jgi:hypothetical protein